MFKPKTILLWLSIITFLPALSLALENAVLSRLYDYAEERTNRYQHGIFKRQAFRMKSISDEDVTSVLETAESVVRHLGQYEDILQSRNLLAAEGSPTHTAMLMSWGDDRAVNISKKSYTIAKASYYLSHKLCMRYGNPSSFCSDQLKKLFRLPPNIKHCTQGMYRSYNGSCNNELHPSWGSAFTAYNRLIPPAYKDGILEPKEKEIMPRLNAAEISEAVLRHSRSPSKDATLAVVAWASFVTYDMSHTVSSRMFSNGAPVTCCQGTDWKLAPRHRHPLCLPIVNRRETKCYNYVRSMLAPHEDYRFGPGQQMNTVTHLLDGSDLYGINKDISKFLRIGNKGKIRILRIDAHKTLPLLFSPSSNISLVPGEIRMNVDIISSVIRTIFVHEHNRISAELAVLNKNWDDEKLFQESRRIVIAELQHITYNEWLPILLGDKDVSKRGLRIPKYGYGGVYNKNIPPAVTNSFANAAMRFIVSLLDERIIIYNEDRTPSGNFSLRYNLIDPKIFNSKSILASLVRGLTIQNCQSNDLSLPEAVTKYLFSDGNKTGFDALSFDIQRGRDHGLPPYVAFRKMYGLPYETFNDLLRNIPREIVNTLKETYIKVNSIDLIVGGLAEIPKKGSLLGPVFSNIIAQQMVATRVGDRYFYDNKDQPHPFTLEQLGEIRKVTLARLLCDNSSIKRIQPFAFLKSNSYRNKLTDCSNSEEIKKPNLKFWKE